MYARLVVRVWLHFGSLSSALQRPPGIGPCRPSAGAILSPLLQQGGPARREVLRSSPLQRGFPQHGFSQIPLPKHRQSPPPVRPDHSLAPVVAMPWMKVFWVKKKRITMGTTMTVEAAMR